jgi:outer membrane biosynthesis protein TonB
MTGAPLALDVRTLRRADERRVSIAIGASLVIHALTIAALRGLVPAIYAFPQAGAGNFATLQAVLAGPTSEAVPTEPVETEVTAEPNLLLPPAEQPIEVPLRRPPPHTGPPPGGNPARTGPNTPAVNIGVGMIDDPGRLGPDFVARLAQRFPDRVAKPPLLTGTPVIAYPPAALEAGVERRVAVLLTLRADGSIQESQLAHEDPLFGPAVLDALKSAHFAPAEIDGNPVPYWAIVEFVFLLGRPAAPPVAAQGMRRGATYPYPPQPSVGR